MRVLNDAGPRPGTVSRIVRRLPSLRSLIGRPLPSASDAHELTEYACVFADGTMGRVAIRQSGGEWIAVCVVVA
jgi:hypothetical protein